MSRGRPSRHRKGRGGIAGVFLTFFEGAKREAHELNLAQSERWCDIERFTTFGGEQFGVEGGGSTKITRGR